MTLRAHFRSIEQPTAIHELEEVVYDHEGSLLEVFHPLEPLKARSAGDWKQLFGGRSGSMDVRDRSGVWGKKEWVLPQIPDEHIVSLAEGWNPLLPATRTAARLGLSDVRLKLCGTTHTGSFKDLGMTVLVSWVNHLRRTGADIRAVACASTGDTSAALAAYAAAAGIPAIVFLPADKVSLAQLIQPVANGAHVLALETDFDGCMRVVQELTQDKTVYLANSKNSLRIEGQKTVAIETVQQLGWKAPDWFVIPGGNLGNVSALAKGLDLLFELGLLSGKRPRIAVAQAAAADPLVKSFEQGLAPLVPQTARDTLASAIRIGNPVSFPKALDALRRYDGVAESVSEDRLADAAARNDLEGFYNCPHTGVALGALEQLVEKGTIAKGESAVVVSTAHGLKFSEFKTGYHEGRLSGVESRLANRVVRIAPTYAAVQDALKAILPSRP
jgi:threonine synthase